jgi:hypothetical protein
MEGEMLRLDYVSKFPLQEMMQFLTPKELCRLGKVNKRFYKYTRDDYLWRYMLESCHAFYNKNYSDSWQECFRRNDNTKKKMQKEKWDFEMCPIRHFKNTVAFIDSFLNFVFAVDTSGKLGMFLIHEQLGEIDSDDSDEDREKQLAKELQLQGEPLLLKFFSTSMALVVVTT